MIKWTVLTNGEIQKLRISWVNQIVTIKVKGEVKEA